MKLFYVYFLLLFFSITQTFAQGQPTIDSLEQVLETKLSDTKRVDTYIALATEYSNLDSAKTVDYATKALALATEINYGEAKVNASYTIAWALMVRGYYANAQNRYEHILKEAETISYTKGEANALNGLGNTYLFTGRYDSASVYFLRSIELQKKIDDKTGLSYNYHSLGNLYFFTGEYEKALDNFYLSLEMKDALGDENGKLGTYIGVGNVYYKEGIYSEALSNYLNALSGFEKVGDKRGIGMLNSNIGNVFLLQDDYEKALRYFEKALEVQKDMGSQKGISDCYNSMGSVYKKMGQRDKAITYLNKSLEIKQQLGNLRGVANSYISISDLYLELGDLKKSLEYVTKSLEVRQQIGDKWGIASSTIGIGKNYLAMKQYDLAYAKLKEGLALAEELGSLASIEKGSRLLAEVEEKRGNFREAYNAHVLFKQMADSLKNEENTKKLTRLEAEYEFQKEKDSIAFEQQKTTLALEQEQQKKQLILRSAIGGGVLALIILVVLYQSYRVKKQKNEELTDKNTEISNLRETEKKLAEETLALKERELTTFTMLSHEKNNILQRLEDQITQLSSRVNEEVLPDLKEIKNTIKANLSEESWGMFMYQFERVHPRFFNDLRQKYPELTQNDLKLCAYMKVGLGNKEIAQVSNITVAAVKKSINRMKKKLNLEPEADLREFLMEMS